MQYVKTFKAVSREFIGDINVSEWLSPVLKVFSSQVLLQIIGFGISILLIRQMPKEDYAIYTIFISLLAILNILSDSGIVLGFNALGGKIWNDEKKFASLLKTASFLRARITILAFAIAGIYGMSILISQDSSSFEIFVIIGSLLLIVSPEIHKAFIQQALLLQKDVGNVQLLGIIHQGMRLLLIIAVIFLVKVDLTIEWVLCITIVSVWVSFLFILRKSKHLRSSQAKINGEYKKVLLHYIKINWHNAAFFSFQGQISIFLIGILGSTTNLAELGALTRYGLIYTALTAFVTNILGPAFGKCQEKSKLIKTFLSTLVVILLFSLATLFVVYLFPTYFLWILGEQYQQLSYELSLVFVAGSIGFVSSTIFTLNSYKGWIRFSRYFEIPANILSLVLGVIIFDISTLEGVLYLSIVGASTNLLLYTANSFAGFRYFDKALRL